ncbi:MAG: sialate O-acetylesterase [Planctomycetota bacterium]
MKAIARLVIIAGLLQAAAHGEVRVPAVLSDHMVLQADKPVSLWGWAEPGEEVVASIGHRERSTVADANGRWSLSLGSFTATHEPRDLRIRGRDNEVVIRDVLVGEVWLCSGQSNMVWRVQSSDGFEAAKRSADLPAIRMFTGALRSESEAQTDLPGTWQVCTPETVGDFSAVAFYFGRELQDRLGVPIGLVNVSWGGSTVEAWTRLSALVRCPEAERVLTERERYLAALNEDITASVGPDLDETAWKAAALPATFKDLGHEDLDGIVWFRRKVEIPEAWRGRALKISLGGIDDEDHTYFAGHQIGHTNNWQTPRTYDIPSEQSDVSSATLAIRVRDGSGPGGFNAAPSELFIEVDGNDERLSLSGAWWYRVVSDLSPPGAQQIPAALSNGMIAPLEPLRFRGVLWYQGENNAFLGKAHEYGGLLTTLIRDWRSRFREPKLPFLVIQLPEFAENESGTWDYPRVREGQWEAYRALPETGLIVTLGLGDERDIHPRDKLGVGRRAARWARSQVYDEVLPRSGPIFQGAEFLKDGRVRLHFETFGEKLKDQNGGELEGFRIAGTDRRFEPATARIEGPSTVMVWSANVKQPKSVRYAFENTPKNRDLETVLPAAPFRTDRW